jgi:hypothetical protein
MTPEQIVHPGSLVAPRFEQDWTKYAAWMLQTYPQIYREYRRLLDERLRHHPKEVVGSRMVFEVLRWNTSANAPGDIFKLNNNIMPLLSRLYIFERPQYAENFKLRKSCYDTWQDYPEIVEAFNDARR